ncbi:MAG: DUF2950 family protein [Planctomycetota bacterium]
MGVITTALALFFVGTGLMQLLFPAACWRLHAWAKRFEGVSAERTPEWDTMRGCTSVLSILCGLGLLVYGCSQKDKPDARPSSMHGVFARESPPRGAHVQFREHAAATLLRHNETTAIESLRNIVSAQAMLQQAARVDVDEDGDGEYGGILEMSGEVSGRMPSTLRIPQFPSFEFERASGVATRTGYCYRLYLPDASGAGVAEPPLGFTADKVSAAMCERAWCCYAWPTEYGVSGTRTFFANQEGQILATDDSAYNGTSRGPSADAAFLGPGIVGAVPDPGPSAIPVPRASGHAAVGARGQDKNTWRLID